MREPTRLFEQHRGELESVLLAAMRADRPRPGSRERALAMVSRWAPAVAVGFWAKGVLAHLGPWTKVGLCLVAAGTAPVAVAVVRSPDTGPSRGSRAAVAAALPQPAAGRGPHAVREGAPAEPAASAVPTPGPLAPPRASSALLQPRGGPRSAGAPFVVGEPASERPRTDAHDQRPVGSADAQAASTGAFPLVAPSTLEAEVAALRGVRSALDTGSSRTALQRLDRYRQEFPRGSLAFEASVLRVQALLRTGDRAQAETLARSLLAMSPNGPHAHRIRTLLGWPEE